MIYGTRANGNQHGLVLTKPIVVDVMLDRAGYSHDFDLRAVKVIEPAAGDGAFAISIIDRLYASSLKFGFSFQNVLSNLVFFEINEYMASVLSERIEARLSEYSAYPPKDLVRKEDFLLSTINKCNLIIGNPPYVRHENIPEKQKKEYRKLFRTFTHRSDLYIAFYEKSLRLLEANGILSFICSNRWLKNQYGKSLRNLIRLSYALDEIIDLEGTCPFEEEVIAYPAITTIHKSCERHRENYYRIHDIGELDKIDISIKPSRTLNTKNPLNWFSYESLIEKELLVPILTSKDVKNNQFMWSGNYVLNPFAAHGGLIDLNKYPKAKKYLDSKKDLLLKRHIARKNPNSWYKTIDRIIPQLTNQNKIILPDISGNSHLFIDRGLYYPHHNLYYITGQNYDKLVLLAAILMSEFVKNQLLELGNKMNGGYPRWQSQNLKKLWIPIIDAIPAETSKTLADAYHKRDYKVINGLITERKISDYNFSVGQTKLFEPEPEKYKEDI